MNCPPCNHNCAQGHACPAFHPHRLNEQDFDTLGDRPPTDGYSVWAAAAAVLLLIVVVTVFSVLNVKGLK